MEVNPIKKIFYARSMSKVRLVAFDIDETILDIQWTPFNVDTC